MKLPMFVMLLGLFLGLGIEGTYAQSPPARAKKIVVLGDSIADGFGVDKDKSYPAILESMLKKNGHSLIVVNAGISGSTTASALSRLKWQLRQKPYLLIIELGGNDGLRGIAVSSSKSNLSKTIKLAKENGVKTLITGMRLPANYGEKYRREFEEMFSQLAIEHQVPLMPFLLKGVGGKPEFNLPDGIHPNEKGHSKIAENLLPYVEKELQ
ncbi:MAG: arylesterase [Bdellovibrionales bacterium]|nr:arylesterase [Bdellovibrionales bacterium]